MRRTALALMPLARAIRSAGQWGGSSRGSGRVRAPTRAAPPGPSGGMREGRVLSCRRPSMPSFMNRSCQRQTQVFDLPVRRMISLVPTPSALERMIAARQACFCEALRSLVIASSRPRTDRVIVMEIPVRMRQTRTATETVESQSGLFCQAKTTRVPGRPSRGSEGAFPDVQLDCPTVSAITAPNDIHQPSSWSFQRANSDLVQKVQPNDKSGKLLPNNHTQGRKRAPGHLMSKGLRVASAPRNDLNRHSPFEE